MCYTLIAIQCNAKKGEIMKSTPRYTHSFTLSQEWEDRLQEALKKLKAHSGGEYGIIDIVKAGINKFARPKTKVD